MNVYQLLEDGEHRLYRAESMKDALDAGFEAHVRTMLEDGEDVGELQEERDRWEREVLQGCALVGELEN